MKNVFFQWSLLAVLLISQSACLPGPEWLTSTSNLKLIVSGLLDGERFSFSIADQERSVVKRAGDDVLELSMDVRLGSDVLSLSVSGERNRCLTLDVEVDDDGTTIALDVTQFPACDVVDAGTLQDASNEDAGEHQDHEDAGHLDGGDDDDDDDEKEDAGDSEPEQMLDAGFVDSEDDAGAELDAGVEVDSGLETDSGTSDAGDENGWRVEKIRLQSDHGDCGFENCDTFVEVRLGVLVSRGFDDVEREVVLSAADFAFVASSASGAQADGLFDDGCDFIVDVPRTFLRRERQRGGQDRSDEVETTGCEGVAEEIQDRILLLKSLYLP